MKLKFVYQNKQHYYTGVEEKLKGQHRRENKRKKNVY
jgi:hypothetical protein